ncbi:MAG: DUF169 domain-containing protein [Methanobacterium sp.]|nr:DUF169 domain-containing protein [Methanobacterium sp.]
MSKTIKEIGKSLKMAGMLETAPLCVYGSDTIPEGAVPMVNIDTCSAKAVLTVAVRKDTSPVYMGHDCLKGVCMGGITWLGYAKKISPYIRYFVSTGHENFRGGIAEYLKASPELFDKFRESIGEITIPGKYLVVSTCNDFAENEDNSGEDHAVQSVLCFGNGQQIRNLCSLIHFRTENPFESIIAPFGPACATMITYPAHMAQKTPKNTAFIGPVDPTGNSWFPTDYMALGIPLNMARDMCQDLGESFAVKRPEVAYPPERNDVKP